MFGTLASTYVRSGHDWLWNSARANGLASVYVRGAQAPLAWEFASGLSEKGSKAKTSYSMDAVILAEHRRRR